MTPDGELAATHRFLSSCSERDRRGGSPAVRRRAPPLPEPAARSSATRCVAPRPSRSDSRLHPAEQLPPATVDGFLADSDLQRKTGSGWATVPGPLPSGGADLRLDQRLCRARDGVAATSCYASAEAAHHSTPVVYGAAFRAKNRIDLQYWLWYPYNAYSPTRARRATSGRCTKATGRPSPSSSTCAGKPLVLGLSRHSAGARREWSKVERSAGTGPSSTSALGSHANFFGPGRTASILARRSGADLVIEAYGARPVDHAGKGRVVRPRLVPVTDLEAEMDGVRRALGRGRVRALPGQRADHRRRRPSRPRVPRAVAAPWPRCSWPRG